MFQDLKKKVKAGAVLQTRVDQLLNTDFAKENDLLTIFTHKTVFDKIVKVLSLDFQNKVDYVAAPEAIGWILGTAIAKELGVGFIGVRKGDKLPYAKEEIISTHFTDYSGQDKSFEISKSSIVRNKRVLIVDDWIETGSQMKALIALLEKLDCSIIGLATIGIDINEVTQKWIDSSFVAYIGSNI
nr:phosphoribosyltransferase family protein [Campylobacter coli]